MTPLETLKSIRYTLKSVSFEDVVLVTSTSPDSDTFAQLFNAQREIGFRVIESQQGGRLDYEDFVLRKLHTCFKTSHCLFVEWDSGVVNPIMWQDSWGNYDYIGAPWCYPENLQPGYPATTAANCVGNGGFSLRSRALCQDVAALVPEGTPGIGLSDVYICRTRREDLELVGHKFAPFEVAERFSCENKIYSGQFGFHGKQTVSMNGWNWDLR